MSKHPSVDASRLRRTRSLKVNGGLLFMGAMIDLSGKVFDRLTVLRKEGRDSHGRALWKCKCTCGTDLIVISANLRSGNTGSCGCIRSRFAIPKESKSAETRKSPTYISWASMWSRCTNSNRNTWKYYGGRGITVCNQWKRFDNFVDDMGERPAGKSLDRINTNGNYEPNNCRWATASEQMRNRRT